ncbi:hypothetical protein D7B12_18100 [Salmonella enterica]|nr:hypothetical protein [Salmonella enterica]
MAAKTLDPKVFQFLARYRELCGDTPTVEQALLLDYLQQAGNELPVFNSRHWFYKAWRVADCIRTQYPGEKDMIVWHLIKIEPLITQVVNELLPEADPYAL